MEKIEGIKGIGNRFENMENHFPSPHRTVKRLPEGCLILADHLSEESCVTWKTLVVVLSSHQRR
jgi:hypothetical protein